jgi:hypothetical protein
MGVTKQAQIEEMEWDSVVDMEEFMVANGVGVSPVCQVNHCIIEVAGKVNGRLYLNPLTRREAVDLLRGLGVAILNEYAG